MGGKYKICYMSASLETVTRILQWSLSVQGELHTFGLVHLTHSSISCPVRKVGSFHFHAPSIRCATNFK